VDFDLPAMARKARPSRRAPAILPAIEPTPTLERELASIYLRVVRAWSTGAAQLLQSYQTVLATERLLMGDSAVRVRDDAGQLRGEAEGVAISIERLIMGLVPDLRAWTERVEAWHRKRWQSQVMTATAVNISTMIGPEDAERPMSAIIESNVSLIRSVSSEARTRIEGIIFRGFTTRAAPRDIAKELRQAVDMSRARSLRIASDQTVKLSAALDGERMRQAGIKKWAWMHSGKLHFRPWHKERDGNVYTWDNPPSDMPGEEPFCGCKKRAVIEFDEPLPPVPKPRARPGTPRPPATPPGTQCRAGRSPPGGCAGPWPRHRERTAGRV
jgi:SPP1 gp7 family putative phage head morphogenesis protein